MIRHYMFGALTLDGSAQFTGLIMYHTYLDFRLRNRNRYDSPTYLMNIIIYFASHIYHAYIYKVPKEDICTSK